MQTNRGWALNRLSWRELASRCYSPNYHAGSTASVLRENVNKCRVSHVAVGVATSGSCNDW